MFRKLFEQPAERKPGRDYASDNLRFLLIFVVVFAHLLEIAAPFPNKGEIYRQIYSFHMPAFLFLFGYFVKPAPRTTLFHWVLPYMVWQTLYCLFSTHILDNAVPLQYTTPYWLLWYMLVCIFYQLLTPMYELGRGYGQLVTLLAVFALALYAGYDNKIDYLMSLSRFFVFQPWYVLGYFCRKHAVGEKFSRPKLRHVPVYLVSAALVCVSVCLLKHLNVPDYFLYGSTSYASTQCSVWLRLLSLLIAFSWIAFLFLTLRVFMNRKLFLITMIGQNTLPIFLLHGFAVRGIRNYFPSLTDNPWKVLLLTCVLLAVLGNRVMKTAVDLIGLTWLKRFSKPSEENRSTD